MKNVIDIKLHTMYILQSGRTPLHEATSRKSNDQIVDSLVKAGANVNVVDEVSYW